MSYLNLGILAHVDAGKTSLTERLLFHTGVIDRIGSVDSGSTQTDTLELERRRGITIQSAVVSFALGDLTVNLIDTPGHSDFIAEVERALRVLDGAVLVVSAVEGIQAQTRVLMRTLEKLRIPTVVFVNKVDRAGARDAALVADIRARLRPRALPMSTVHDIGSRAARVQPRSLDEPGFTAEAAELLSESNDAFLTEYLQDPSNIDGYRCQGELARQTAMGLVSPVFFGSAVTGVGVPELAEGIRRYLPPAATAAGQAPVGTVFKVERGPAGEKIAFVRMRAGVLRPRTRLEVHRINPDGGSSVYDGRITGLSPFGHGGATRRTDAPAGAIAKVWGLPDVLIGDTIGAADEPASGNLFAQPTLQTVIAAKRPTDRMALHAALTSLAERDPLVQPYLEAGTGDITIKLYGEVQKEVITAMLADEFGIEVTFTGTRTIHIEKPVGTGEAIEEMGPYATTYFQATIGLRVAPGPVGSGVTYGLEVERGSLLPGMHRAVEETVHTTLRSGLYGWAVTDCAVTLIRSGYVPPGSTPSEFRKLTPLVLMRALRQAGTAVYEPMNRFRLEIPEEAAGQVLTALAESGAAVTGHSVEGGTYLLSGTMRAAKVTGLEQRLPGLSGGESVFLSDPDGHRLVVGEPPVFRSC